MSAPPAARPARSRRPRWPWGGRGGRPAGERAGAVWAALRSGRGSGPWPRRPYQPRFVSWGENPKHVWDRSFGAASSGVAKDGSSAFPM